MCPPIILLSGLPSHMLIHPIASRCRTVLDDLFVHLGLWVHMKYCRMEQMDWMARMLRYDTNGVCFLLFVDCM
jgi:hypothetical protein